jgi:hypothetical protein
MNKLYAQIFNGIVKNVIILNEDSEENINTFKEGFDYLIRVDKIIPQPGVNWSYEQEIFIPPLILVKPKTQPEEDANFDDSTDY